VVRTIYPKGNSSETTRIPTWSASSRACARPLPSRACHGSTTKWRASRCGARCCSSWDLREV